MYYLHSDLFLVITDKKLLTSFSAKLYGRKKYLSDHQRALDQSSVITLTTQNLSHRYILQRNNLPGST